MKAFKRFIFLMQVVLILPAALFICTLLIRYLQPSFYEPAHTAEQIIMWYAERPWTLWVLLIALPLAVLVIGCAGLMRSWADDEELRDATRQLMVILPAHMTTVFLGVATAAAGIILAVVFVHMIMK